VAGCAGWIGSMGFEALPEGCRRDIAFLFAQRWHIGWRWRRGSAEDLLEDIFAALHGRRSRRHRGHREHTRHGEDAATVHIAGEDDLAEGVTGDSGDAVELGEAFVEVRVIGVDQ